MGMVCHRIAAHVEVLRKPGGKRETSKWLEFSCPPSVPFDLNHSLGTPHSELMLSRNMLIRAPLTSSFFWLILPLPA